MAGARLQPRWLFRQQQAALADDALPLLILRRVENVDAAGDYRDGAAFQRAVVRGGVDAARQAGNDYASSRAQGLRELPRETACRRGSITRTDHGDSRAL